MTKEELILKTKAKVRRDSNLMSIYIELFFQQFGYRPNCAGCSFNSDWDKFARSGNNSISVVPASIGIVEKTFAFKDPAIIMLSYKKDKITYRKYSNKATDAFVREYLKHGTKEEIKQRKNLFKTLPEKAKK